MLLSVYYVDAINGKDTYSGLAGTYTSGKTGPWQTLAKVNSKTFKAGDQVLFQRGDVWRGQLSNAAAAGHRAYPLWRLHGNASLAKPLFVGSIEEDSTSNWSTVGRNIWTTASGDSNSVDLGNMIYNNGESCGLKSYSS